MPKLPVSSVVTQPHLTAVRQPTTTVLHTRPMTTRPRFTVGGVRNRRYAAVLARLSNQTVPELRSTSSAFSGYVPKCKQNLTVEHKAARSVSCVAAEQRRTKVSFCLQPSHDEHKMTAVSSKSVVTFPSSAASVTAVTCSETVTSTTASLLPPSTDSSVTVGSVPSVPRVQVPADSVDISLLCSELFVDNNASFCDELLESFPGSYEQPDVPHVMPGNLSSDLKQDIPEPVTDFTFDDFVAFDDIFCCN